MFVLWFKGNVINENEYGATPNHGFGTLETEIMVASYQMSKILSWYSYQLRAG
jgi:hypothetical protein